MKYRYSVLVCRKCTLKNVVRNDRAKQFKPDEYLCESCCRREQGEKKFLASLGDAASLIKDTHVEDKHRFVLVDCASCGEEYWARFDNWIDGCNKCWHCTHPTKQSHGKTGTVLHRRWWGIVRRTTSEEPNHARVYKNRGIIMCDEWRRDFLSFERWALENGFKENLVLDRIDNYRGYSPDNCRWITPKESTKNRRKFTYV